MDTYAGGSTPSGSLVTIRGWNLTVSGMRDRLQGHRIGAVTTLLIVGFTGWSEENVAGSEPGRRPLTQWMRGVPCGSRVLSLDLIDDEVEGLETALPVNLLGVYPTASGELDKTILLGHINILESNRLAPPRGEWPILRVFIALTSHEAARVELAAACGALRLCGVAGGASRSVESTEKTWIVRALEDRTEEIENALRDDVVDWEMLQRPTIAPLSPRRASRAGGVLVIPVEIAPQNHPRHDQ